MRVRSYELGTLRLSNHTNAEYGLQVRRAGTPQRVEVDCLASMKNKHNASFPRIQRRIASSGIEPGVSNLSITTPTLYP